MDFNQASERYRELSAMRAQNKLDEVRFAEEVAALKVQDSEGHWWQVNYADGSWLRWSGTSWVEDIPPGLNVFPMPQPAEGPQTLVQLFVFLVKSFKKNMPKMLIQSAVIAVLIWFAHAYILIVLNNGYLKVGTAVPWSADTLALRLSNFNNVAMATTLWTVVGWLLSFIFFNRIIGRGPINYAKDIFFTPLWISNGFKNVRSGTPRYLIFLSAIVLVLNGLIDNVPLALIVGIALVVALTARFEGLSYMFINLGYSDFQRLFRKDRQPKQLNEGYLIALFLSVALAMLLYVVLPFKPYSAYLAAGLFVGVGFFLIFRPKTSAITIVFTLYYAFIIYLFLTEGASAHDVGFEENGRDWGRVLASEARNEALGVGNIPAAGGFLGALLGTLSSAASSVAKTKMLGFEASSTPVSTIGMGIPSLQGGPRDNRHTAFGGGDGPGECSKQGLPNYWVNTAILNLVVQDTVYGWEGIGPSVDLTLTYNSGSADSMGPFGMGWSFTYDWLLTQSDSSVVITKGSGQREDFSMPDGDEATTFPVELSPPVGCYHRLLYYRDYWLYIEKGSQLINRFDQVPGTQQARLTRIFDHHNNILTIGLNKQGHIDSVTDAVGRVVFFKYSDFGLCTSFSLPDGRATSFEYDNAGNLSRVVDLLDVASDYQYDAESCLIQMVVGRSRRTTSFSYSGSGDGKVLEKVTNANGNTNHYELFSTEPRKVKITDPGQRVTLYQSNISGMTEEVTYPTGSCICYKYKDALPISLINKKGHVIFWEHDQRGNIVKATNPLEGSISFEYDQYDRLIKVIDTLNGVLCYKYDQKHNLVELILPGGEKAISEVNEAGQIIATTDFAGCRLLFTYDRYGNLETITNQDQSVSRFKYDEHGFNLMAVTDPHGNTTYFTYDKNGRLLTTTHPDGSVHSDVYDCCVGVSSIDENGHERFFARDDMLSILAYYDGEGNTIGFEYDNCGNLVTVIDPKGFIYRWNYDTAGQLTQITDPLGGIVSMTRDVDGILLVLRDVMGNETFFEYDENNRMVRWEDSLGFDVKYFHDIMGRTASLVNARGNRIDFSYNNNGLIINKSCDNHPLVELEYDNGGNIVNMTDTVGKTFYSYNTDNRLSAMNYPDGTAISMDYDEVGNLTCITYPGGLQVCNTYDNRNRITRVDWDESFISYNRDCVGNILAETRSNCVNSLYQYNANNHVVSIRHGNKDEAYVQISYTRDKSGNITHEEGIYPLNPKVILEDVTITYNKLNQVNICGDESYNYDEDGNLISIGSDRWKACYDAENRLTELVCENKRFHFKYNGLGQRVSTILQQGELEQVERVWHYDLSHRLLYESDGEGQVVARYIYAGALLVARVNAAGESQFYHFDKTGNTLVLTDEKGQVVIAYAYNPFGEITAQSSQPENNPFTFVGEHGVVDDDSGLYFMQTRYYESLTGRFIQRDPSCIVGGLNLYTYALNNPVTTIDPKGMSVTVALTIIMGAGVLLTGRKIGQDVSKGVIIRALAAAEARMNDPENVTPQDVIDLIGPNPAEQVVREILGAVGEGGVDILINHAFFQMPANTVKTMYDIGSTLINLDKIITATGQAIPKTANNKSNCQTPSSNRNPTAHERSVAANEAIKNGRSPMRAIFGGGPNIWSQMWTATRRRITGK